MVSRLNKFLICSNIVWYIAWMAYIAFFAKEESVYFFLAEFASVVSFLIIATSSKEKIMARILIFVALVLVFSPVFLIYAGINVAIYFWAAEIFRLVQFRFQTARDKSLELEKSLKNIIILILSGILGLGIFSIFVYFIIKTIDEFFELIRVNFRIIRLGTVNKVKIPNKA